MAQITSVVGIDVSQATLDANQYPGGAARQVSNAAPGFAELIVWLQQLGANLVVMEASGGYEQAPAKALRQAGFMVRIVDPKRVRYYALSQGRLAKNDRIDAQMIARFAHSIADQLYLPIEPNVRREQLAQLVGVRQDLLVHQTSLANQARLLPAGQARDALQSVRQALARAKARVEQQIAVAIKASPPFRVLARRLTTVPGLGPVAVAALIAWLPELGRLKRRYIAALVGVAPYDDDSGERKGVRHIRGGRLQLRNILYMAAGLCGTRFNPVLKRHYARLLGNGKPKKLAQIACLRKLLTIINSMVANQQDWQPKSQPPRQPTAQRADLQLA